MLSKYKILLKATVAAFRPVLVQTPECKQVQLYTRLFASNANKGNGRGASKPPGTTRTAEECTARPIKQAAQSKSTGPTCEKPARPAVCDTALKTEYPKSQLPVEKIVPFEGQSNKPDLIKEECINAGGGGGGGGPPSEKKNYGKLLLIALAVTAATLYALYLSGLFDTDEDKSAKDKSAKEDKSKSKSKKKKLAWCPQTIIKNPSKSTDIPNEVPYLLIGGGTASFSAFRSIKSLDPSAKVLVISSESDYPYMRPPLSKEIWYNDDHEATKKLRFKQWNGTERSLFYEPEDFYTDCKDLKGNANGGVAVARGWTVTKVDVNEKTVYLDDGYAIKYDNCLIATGSTPNNLAIFKSADEDIQDKVSLYREIYDFQKLNDIINAGAKDIAIVGGGFLGSELACALARKGKKSGLRVHQVFRETGNMGKVLPEYLSQWTTARVKEEGVEVVPNATVNAVSSDGDALVLTLSTGGQVRADHVVVAVGANPNTELAVPSRLELDTDHGGYLVNAELMARSHVWIAGDCAAFFDPKLGRRRVEHHDHAVVSGRLAGENMTGAGRAYCHQSMFWSDLGPDVGYEAIGIVDAALPTVGVFAKATERDTPRAVVTATDEVSRAETEANAGPVTPSTKPLTRPKDDENYGKGVIFYLRNDIVVGIVLWNVFNRMSVARQVLQEERKYNDLNEVAKLFNIHEE